jgi:hypothetical protein
MKTISEQIFLKKPVVTTLDNIAIKESSKEIYFKVDLDYFDLFSFSIHFIPHF